MTRAAQVAHAVTALREARTADGSTATVTSVAFRVFEDNGGRYHWAIVAGGETLVLSSTFASYEEAEQAARTVYDGASSASFEARSSDTQPDDAPARRDAATTRNRVGAERRSNEPGSFGGQAFPR